MDYFLENFSATVFYILIFTLIILTVGTPDILDGVIKIVNNYGDSMSITCSHEIINE